ncbi:MULTISPECIES: hypothetical protein [Sutcliffiella]|uniref:Uncharacterized protein n=1 Tax=Sutcliffiella cohnii TaxID=33932 RepID=A0A223KTR0_9BACI|nr:MULTISPECIES: hypothetical protein [Sutcliffiella]AST92869.1 hypothetical protein BC6307_17035 [Sutcliffiella cohnii]WBL14126.1 hypothetical protein O1A01_19775 [Sutcliffiella sp. NC1]
MKESRKERMVRFGILAVVISFTIYLFTVQFSMFQQASPTEDNATDIPFLVEVLQEKDENHANPIISMVREAENKPVLISYEIKIENNFQFSTINAIELQENPTRLLADESEGVWLGMDDDWTLFTEELEIVTNSKNVPEQKEQNYEMVVEETESYYLMKIMKDGELLFQKNFQEQPLSIKRLSITEDLWLVIFNNDVTVLFS